MSWLTLAKFQLQARWATWQARDCASHPFPGGLGLANGKCSFAAPLGLLKFDDRVERRRDRFSDADVVDAAQAALQGSFNRAR